MIPPWSPSLNLTNAQAMAHMVAPYLRQDVSGLQQWKHFERHARLWKGSWIRVRADGTVFASTTMKRHFEEIPNGRDGHPAYLQSVIYDDAEYSFTGMKTRQYVHIKTDPPSWARYLSPDGTLSISSDYASIAFFPYGFAHAVGGSMSTTPTDRHYTEFLILHPFDPDARIALYVVYVGAKYSYTSVAREIADVDSFPAGPWKGGDATDVIDRLESRDGSWTEVTHSLSEPDLIYERKHRVLENGLPPLPSGPDYATVRLRDGPVTLSVPVEFAPVGSDVDVSIHFEWEISPTVFVRNVLTLSTDGIIKHNCGSVYIKRTVEE